MALTNGQTRETLANDMWQACKILPRDNNCGGVMEYIEHLAWLLFLRFWEAQEDFWQTEAELADKPYERILEGDLAWANWARKDWPAGVLQEKLREAGMEQVAYPELHSEFEE